MNKRNQDKIFYQNIWDKSKHICEECGTYLQTFNPSFISHILSKGAFPQLRYDERNINILCFKHHEQWEFWNKKEMRIWIKNKIIIEKLKFEIYTNKKKE